MQALLDNLINRCESFRRGAGVGSGARLCHPLPVVVVVAVEDATVTTPLFVVVVVEETVTVLIDIRECREGSELKLT